MQGARPRLGRRAVGLGRMDQGICSGAVLLHAETLVPHEVGALRAGLHTLLPRDANLQA
jgi:hypothetical protein